MYHSSSGPEMKEQRVFDDKKIADPIRIFIDNNND